MPSERQRNCETVGRITIYQVVQQGVAELMFEKGKFLRMTPGDHMQIPAYKTHRVEWTTTEKPTVWLGVFYRE